MTSSETREGAAEAASAIHDAAERVKANIGRVMVGKDDVIDLVLVALLSEGHLLIEDVPGIGKTTLAKAISRSIGCSFKRIQFTPDVMPSDITGINFYNQKQGEFEFRPGPIIANIVLADEINRATPRTQSALLEAMEERQVTVEGVTMRLPSALPGHRHAEPDRARRHVPAAGSAARPLLHEGEAGLSGRGTTRTRSCCASKSAARWTTLEPVVAAEELVRLSHLVPQVHCEPSVRHYVVQIVQATRKHAAYELGASPRGSLSLFRGGPRPGRDPRPRLRAAGRRQVPGTLRPDAPRDPQLAEPPARPRRGGGAAGGVGVGAGAGGGLRGAGSGWSASVSRLSKSVVG